MGASVQNQAYVFLTTLYGGIIIGFTYDIYRIFRYFSNPKKFITFIEDLIFWIIVSIIALIILFFSNWGEVRGFVFLGFVSGALIYSKFLSKIVITILVKVIRYISQVIKRVFGFLIYPFILLSKYLYAPYASMKKRMKKIYLKTRRIIKLPFRVFSDIKKYTKTILLKK